MDMGYHNDICTWYTHHLVGIWSTVHHILACLGLEDMTIKPRYIHLKWYSPDRKHVFLVWAYLDYHPGGRRTKRNGLNMTRARCYAWVGQQWGSEYPEIHTVLGGQTSMLGLVVSCRYRPRYGMHSKAGTDIQAILLSSRRWTEIQYHDFEDKMLGDGKLAKSLPYQHIYNRGFIELELHDDNTWRPNRNFSAICLLTWALGKVRLRNNEAQYVDTRRIRIDTDVNTELVSNEHCFKTWHDFVRREVDFIPSATPSFASE